MVWYCQFCAYESIRSAPFNKKDCPGCKRYAVWKRTKPSDEEMLANLEYQKKRDLTHQLMDTASCLKSLGLI